MLAAPAQSGDRLKALEALRDDLAAKLDMCESMRDYAALSLRFMDTLAQIDDLVEPEPETPKVTSLSDFEKRLAERDAAAKAARRAAKSG